MLRLFIALLIARAALCPARASDLVLTGISASGGTVRAFFSARGGASTFSLHLNEEAAGVRFERIHRRTQQVWIVESGEGRWLRLGSPQEDPVASTPPPHGAGTGGGVRSAGGNASELGESGGIARSLLVAEGTALPVAVDSMEAGTAGVGQADVSSGALHRWKPGVVREPTAAELYRARYGSAALDAAVGRGELRRN